MYPRANNLGEYLSYRIEEKDGHWIWLGSYGRNRPWMVFQGKQHTAAQAVWEFMYDEKASGYLHRKCGETRCVNPEHMDVFKTPNDVRYKQGVNRPRVSEELLVDIHALISAPTIESIAEKYGIAKTTVRRHVRKARGGNLSAYDSRYRPLSDYGLDVDAVGEGVEGL